MSKLTFPQFQAPLTQAPTNRGGFISQAWARWFSGLYNCLGGQQGGVGALYLGTRIDNLHTSGPLYIPMPRAGIIQAIVACVQGTITTSTEILTIKNNAGLVMGSINLLLATTAGTTTFLYPNTNNFVNVGDNISITSSNLSSGAVACLFTIVFQYDSA